jgi:hypothetical protein
MTEKGDMGHLVVVLLLLIPTVPLRDYYKMTIVLLQLCQVLGMRLAREPRVGSGEQGLL